MLIIADRFLIGFCLFVAAPLMILMGCRPQWEMSLRFMALINQMRIGIRAGVAIQLFMLFDDDQNGFLDSRLIYRGK